MVRNKKFITHQGYFLLLTKVWREASKGHIGTQLVAKCSILLLLFNVLNGLVRVVLSPQFCVGGLPLSSYSPRRRPVSALFSEYWFWGMSYLDLEIARVLTSVDFKTNLWWSIIDGCSIINCNDINWSYTWEVWYCLKTNTVNKKRKTLFAFEGSFYILRGEADIISINWGDFD